MDEESQAENQQTEMERSYAEAQLKEEVKSLL